MTNVEVRIVCNDILSDGTDERRERVREFRRQVEDAIRWLPPGVTCDIGDLVTPQFWLPLGKSLRRKLGRFLARWVADGELPLEFVGPVNRSNKRYRLRQ